MVREWPDPPHRRSTLIKKYKVKNRNKNTNPEIQFGLVWKMVKEWRGHCTGGLLQYKYIRATAKTNDWLESGLSGHHLEREQQTNLNRAENYASYIMLAATYCKANQFSFSKIFNWQYGWKAGGWLRPISRCCLRPTICLPCQLWGTPNNPNDPTYPNCQIQHNANI